MGDNSWMDSSFFRDPTKRRKHYLCLLFSQYWTWVQTKINDLLTSPKNQFRDYFIRNRIEKLVPQHWNFAPQTLKTLQTTTKPFSNIGFFAENPVFQFFGL